MTPRKKMIQLHSECQQLLGIDNYPPEFKRSVSILAEFICTKIINEVLSELIQNEHDGFKVIERIDYWEKVQKKLETYENIR